MGFSRPFMSGRKMTDVKALIERLRSGNYARNAKQLRLNSEAADALDEQNTRLTALTARLEAMEKESETLRLALEELLNDFHHSISRERARRYERLLYRTCDCMTHAVWPGHKCTIGNGQEHTYKEDHCDSCRRFVLGEAEKV
jgi:hypothetical protein